MLIVHLGLSLRSVRKAKNLSRKQVYIDLGCTQANYSYYEQTPGIRNSTMRRICEVMKVPEAAIILHAVDESQIPEEYLEMFQKLKKEIVL